MALSSAPLLPIVVGNSERLPAHANRCNLAAKPRGDLRVGRGSQEGFFFRSPGSPMGKFDGDPQAPSPMSNGADRYAKPGRHLVI
jgi:hypothetical protein